MEREIKVGEIWTHYKTKGKYEILFLGRMQSKVRELDEADCVVYKSLADNSIWVRPKVDFLEGVEGAWRFERVI